MPCSFPTTIIISNFPAYCCSPYGCTEVKLGVESRSPERSKLSPILFTLLRLLSQFRFPHVSLASSPFVSVSISDYSVTTYTFAAVTDLKDSKLVRFVLPGSACRIRSSAVRPTHSFDSFALQFIEACDSHREKPCGCIKRNRYK